MTLRLRRQIRTETEKRKIAELFHSGYASDSIAEEMNCSGSFVYVCARKYPQDASENETIEDFVDESDNEPSEDFVDLPETIKAAPVRKEPRQPRQTRAKAFDTKRFNAVCELIEQGKSQREVATELNTSRKSLVKLLNTAREQGLPVPEFQSKRGPKAGFKPANTIEQDKVDEIVHLKTTTGLSYLQIAAQVGVGENTVWRVLKRNNLILSKAHKATATQEETLDKPEPKPQVIDTPSRIPAPSVKVFDDVEEPSKPAPNVPITYEMRQEVMRRHEDEYENIFTIAEQVQIPVNTVRKIIKDDNGAYRKEREL